VGHYVCSRHENKRKDMRRSETTVGVDEPINNEKEQQEDPDYADYDDDELLEDPANSVAIAIGEECCK